MFGQILSKLLIWRSKALMISNSLNHRYFQMKTDMNVKISSYTKLCMQNKILASKMQNIKQQKTSIFAPLILKRWIIGDVANKRLRIFAKLCNKLKLNEKANCNPSAKSHFAQQQRHFPPMFVLSVSFIVLVRNGLFSIIIIIIINNHIIINIILIVYVIRMKFFPCQ